VHASPIGIQFSSVLDYGALAGTPIWGEFRWDDPGPLQSIAPITALTLNIGTRTFNLSHGLFPAVVNSPHLTSSGFANNWGPRFALRPEFLFGGLTHLGLFEGGTVLVSYSYLPTSAFQYVANAQVALVPAASVPEPGSLALILGGLTGCLLVRRRTRRIRPAPTDCVGGS
jgi:hypothetical protein